MRALALGLMLAWCAFSAPAWASPLRKVALVVGVGAYTHTDPLANPVNDARLVAQGLEATGFESVVVVADPDLAAMQGALRSFAAQARGADVAVVYYAGHGLEARGQNWLLPRDVSIRSENDIEFGAVRLESVLRAVDGARVRIVALDACRNNPFAARVPRVDGVLPRGLLGVEVDNVLLMYAAAAGSVAKDSVDSANSPFAIAFARRLREPGVELRIMAGRVRDDVLAATGGEQRPFVSSNLIGESLYVLDPEGRSTAATLSARAGPRNTAGVYDLASDAGATWKIGLLTPARSGDGRSVTVARAVLSADDRRLVEIRCDMGGLGDEETRSLALIDFRFPLQDAATDPALLVNGRARQFMNAGVPYMGDDTIVMLLAALDDPLWADIPEGAALVVSARGGSNALPAGAVQALGDVAAYCRSF